MARLVRAVFAGVPHHVTQRGNGRAQTFFTDDDYGLYRDLLAEHARAVGVEVWSWVLMPNHVHLILTPSDEDGLRAALARTHRRYAGHIHAREKRSGHFWQGRFGCVAMDEALWRRRCITSRSTRCARGWSSGRKTGGGRAFTLTWAWRRTTRSRRPRRCKRFSPIWPTGSRRGRTRR